MQSSPSPLLIFLNPFFTRFTQPFHCFFPVHVKFLLFNCTFTVKHFIKYTSKLIESFCLHFIFPLQFRYIVLIYLSKIVLMSFFFFLFYIYIYIMIYFIYIVFIFIIFL